MGLTAASDNMAAEKAFFECVMAVSDSETCRQMMPNLRRRLENPPTTLVSTVLDQRLTDEQVRCILFNPGPVEMAHYPALLAGDPGCPSDLNGSAANKAQALALGHMYLVHGRAWHRMKPFIEAGGLQSLVQLLSHPNSLLASQSLQLLLLATHPDMYDWHHPQRCVHNNRSSSSNAACPASSSRSNQQHTSTVGATDAANNGCSLGADNISCCAMLDEQQVSNGLHPTSSSSRAGSSAASTEQNAKHPSQGLDGAAWRQLAQLHRGPFLHSLMQLSPDLWPGSGYQALQLLAFYLSWLRAWWSQDGVLQLSPALLSGLLAWSTRSKACPEEQELAAALAKDFGKAGTAGSAADSKAEHAASSGVGVEFEPTVELRVVADRTQINSSPGSEAARLKAAGNDAFKAKDWATAIRLYSAALDVPVPAAALIDEAPRRAVYHTNRAAAYLERIWELQATPVPAAVEGNDSAGSGSSSWREVGGLLDGLMLDGSSESVAKQLESAAMDCKAAIDLVPTYTKAHYRLATALRAQGKHTQALAAAAAAERHASSAADCAAAATLAKTVREQQQQRAQPGAATKSSAVQAATTMSCSTNTRRNSSAGNSALNSPAAVPDPLGQLLQQFASAVCKDSTSAKASGKSALGAKQPDTDTSTMLDIKIPRQATADQAVTSKDTDTLVLPKKQPAKMPAAGKVLVQVLASSDRADESFADLTIEGERKGSMQCSGANGSNAQPGFLLREVQTTPCRGRAPS